MRSGLAGETRPENNRMEESMVVRRKHAEKPEDLCAAP
jgi:hypothetical protein